MRSSLLLLLTLGCASRAPTHDAERVLVTDERGQVLRTTQAAPPVYRINAPPARVRQVLEHVYSTIGIEVSVSRESPAMVGNRAFVVPNRLLNYPRSRFFSCGTTMTGELADEARVTANIVSHVTPTPTGSELSTIVTAAARSLGGASSAPVVCGSTGVLEERIREMTVSRLAAMP